jgi:hypothetical protein
VSVVADAEWRHASCDPGLLSDRSLAAPQLPSQLTASAFIIASYATLPKVLSMSWLRILDHAAPRTFSKIEAELPSHNIPNSATRALLCYAAWQHHSSPLRWKRQLPSSRQHAWRLPWLRLATISHSFWRYCRRCHQLECQGREQRDQHRQGARHEQQQPAAAPAAGCDDGVHVS